MKNSHSPIHSKSNIFCLVEVLGNFTGLKRVESAEQNEHDVVDQRHH